MTAADLVFTPAPLDVPVDATLFASPSAVARLFDRWDVFPAEGSVLRPAMCALIPALRAELGEELDGYLSGRLPLAALARALPGPVLRHFADAPSPELVVERDLGATEDAIDAVLRESLRARPWPDHVHLFGYGVGDGHFERRVRGWLLDDGLCASVAVSGLDPHGVVDAGDVTLADPSRLAELPPIDLFLSRWVLHHVRPADRWDPLRAALARLAPGGVVFVVEEATFGEADRLTPTQRAYTLLFALLDVAINRVFLPDWLGSGDFHLDYVTARQWTTLEARAGLTRRATVEAARGFLRTVVLVDEARRV